MFRLLKYQHDLINDSLEIRVLFQLKPTSEIIQDGGMFTKRISGDRWLEKLKKDYFTIKLENYIVHKKYIIESGPGHKSLCAKKQALAELHRFLLYCCEKASLQEACKWCLNMEQKLTAILPSSTNNSYQSSVTALDEIIQFAKLHHTGALIKQ